MTSPLAVSTKQNLQPGRLGWSWLMSTMVEIVVTTSICEKWATWSFPRWLAYNGKAKKLTWIMNGTINSQLAVPFGSSILHLMCKYKFRAYHRLAANDDRVTSSQELISWTQFLSFNKCCCKRWRTYYIHRIDRPTELLSQIFNILKWKKTIWQIFKALHFWMNLFRKILVCWKKNRLYVIEHTKMNQYWKFHPDM